MQLYDLLGYNADSVASSLENVVYLELCRRGYTVNVGISGSTESDFVAVRQNEKLYVQVTQELRSLKQGKVTVGGVTVLDAAYLIPFKAKAWMDMTDRHDKGEQVDSKKIKKYKNDVFRLTELINPMVKVAVPRGVYADIQEFLQRMKKEEVNTHQLGLAGRTKDDILEELKVMYEVLR